MVFLDSTYSVLLVSSSKKYNETLLPALPSSDFWPVTVAGSVSQARQRMSGSDFDLVIVNAPLPDSTGVDFALDVSADTDSAVLLLLRSEDYEAAYYRALPYGVMTLSKPTSLPMLLQCVRSLCAMRERLRRIRSQQASVEEKIDEIRLINRAKWLLIECLSMTEKDAHHYILTQAMEQRLSKREIAESIIRTYQ